MFNSPSRRILVSKQRLTASSWSSRKTSVRYRFTFNAVLNLHIGLSFVFLGPDVDKALVALHDVLMTNSGYAKWSTVGRIEAATVRVVAAGTFFKYREWKARTSGGQVKVPVSITDAGSKEFFSNSVIRELVFPL